MNENMMNSGYLAISLSAICPNQVWQFILDLLVIVII